MRIKNKSWRRKQNKSWRVKLKPKRNNKRKQK